LTLNTLQIRFGTEEKHEICRSDLSIHPHQPAFGWRQRMLIKAGINAVSTEAIRQRTHPVLLL
jgi:hypothetical protein